MSTLLYGICAENTVRDIGRTAIKNKDFSDRMFESGEEEQSKNGLWRKYGDRTYR